jgi:hypothetical protein
MLDFAGDKAQSDPLPPVCERCTRLRALIEQGKEQNPGVKL